MLRYILDLTVKFGTQREETPHSRREQPNHPSLPHMRPNGVAAHYTGHLMHYLRFVAHIRPIIGALHPVPLLPGPNSPHPNPSLLVGPLRECTRIYL